MELEELCSLDTQPNHTSKSFCGSKVITKLLVSLKTAVRFSWDYSLTQQYKH